MGSAMLRENIRRILEEDEMKSDERKKEMAVNLLSEANTLARQLRDLTYEFSRDITERLKVATELVNELKGGTEDETARAEPAV